MKLARSDVEVNYILKCETNYDETKQFQRHLQQIIDLSFFPDWYIDNIVNVNIL